MFRLSINNENVELIDTTRLQMSRLILDLSDFSKRGINISNSFVLPFTQKNDRLTGYPSRLNSNNQAFEVNSRYILTQQNNIISIGDVVINSFSEKEGIKIQLAEGFGFWSGIGKLKMKDLDLFSNDVVFNNTSFLALDTKTGSPWLWGLGSFADDHAETALSNLQYSRPQYRTKILIDKIIEQSGFTVDYTNVLTVTNIDDLGILSNARNFAVTDYKRFWSNITIASGDITQTGGVLEFSETGNVTLSGNDLINQLYATSYVIKGDVDATIDTTISITYTLGAETNSELVNVPKGRSFLNFRTDEIEIGSSTVLSVGGDILFESVRIYSHMNESDIVDVENNWKGVGQESILNGYQILTDYNLPAMTQSVFFKTLIKQLFLKVDVDELNKVIKLSSFSDILSTNNAIDLTGKTQKFPPYSSGKSFGQLNIMAYQNEDNISEDLGRTTFTIENANAEPSKEFLSVFQFSASEETLISGNTTIHAHIYTVVGANRESLKNRVVSFITGTGIPYSANFSGVSWNNLYSQNYISFIDSIKRERVLKVKLLLSFLEFRRINESPIIFLGELNSYFLVLKISGFEEGEFSNVSMVKFI